MKAHSRLFSALRPISLPMAAAVLCVNLSIPTAHAGQVGWMDRLFTFREEQKPLVTPRSNVRAKQVVQPYYPNDEHVSWSNFYTRTDLETQDYLSSSASKVMRPRAQEHAARTPAQAQGGWPAIAERAMENARDESNRQPSNIAIGEPGEGWGMHSGSSNVGRATRIGPAVEDWRNEGNNQLASRPGDYDYRAPYPVAADGADIRITEPNSQSGGVVTFSGTHDDPRYVGHNAKGQVTKYAVQKGDTLSTISDQPAIYGTWKLWPLIYSANRRAIGGSPNNIKLQQRLDIPRDYTEQQAREAERRAGSAR